MKDIPLLGIVLSAFLFSACSANANRAASSSAPKDQIIGTWQTPTGGTMTFAPGGKLTVAGPKGSVDVTYSFPTDRTVEMKKPGAATGIRYQVDFPSLQEVVLTEANGQRMALKRVN